MRVTRGGRNVDRSRTRGKSEKASPGRGMRRKNEGGSGFKGGVQPIWAIAPSPVTDRSPRLRKVKPQAAVRVDTDLRIVNQDHTWRPGQTTRSGLFADGETKAWGDKGELLGGHSKSPAQSPRAPHPLCFAYPAASLGPWASRSASGQCPLSASASSSPRYCLVQMLR